MSTNELTSKVKDMRELRRMAEELAAEIEGIQDSIKAELTARGADEAQGADWKVTWKPVVTARFDSKAFKSTHSELYEQYTRQSETRRLIVA